MKITGPEDLRIGHWATSCCHLDLERVINDDRLAEIRKEWSGDIAWSAWETEREALLEIAQGWPEDSLENAECLYRANECLRYDPAQDARWVDNFGENR